MEIVIALVVFALVSTITVKILAERNVNLAEENARLINQNEALQSLCQKMALENVGLRTRAMVKIQQPTNWPAVDVYVKGARMATLWLN